MSESDESPVRPVLRVVKGDPTPEELAALTAVVAAAGGGDEPRDEGIRRGGWSDPARSMRTTLLPGPGAWRSRLR